MKKEYNQIAGKKVQRIEAISDGVFAVAFTLLVLDLKVPLYEEIVSEHDLILAFCNLMPNFLSYFLSFMTLGIFWMGHSTQYHYIEKSDRHLNWIALFFLLFVSILPFSTAFLSEHVNFKFSIFLYWFNIFSLGAILYFHWKYANRHGFVNLSKKEIQVVTTAINQRVFVAQSLYFFAALLCFINNYLSITVIIAIQLYYALGLLTKKK